ncbi:shikimate dehydrogenase family protein [Micropruina sp.]|uniref:shikimate dehydrogenase family protein n=1 Tax=Micropruina sp. TaxID=2737536 RepID=UPI0039E3F95A
MTPGHNRPRAAVVGSPIAHSLSPVIQLAGYAHLGLDWGYERIELRPDQFDGFIDGLDDSWRGLSVTMPLKERAAACGLPDDDVVLTGAANTVVFGEQRRVYNTDTLGLVDAMAAEGLAVRVGTVIGNGATARSVAVALARGGVRLIEVQGRNPERLRAFRDWAEGSLGVEVQPRSLGAPLDPATEVLVSTVPSAALNTHLDTLAVEFCPALRVVFDVIYHPWPTPLAGRAASAGLRVLSGLDLLVHQAAHQVRLFTGSEVPVAVLMSAVRAELQRRGAS